MRSISKAFVTLVAVALSLPLLTTSTGDAVSEPSTGHSWWEGWSMDDPRLSQLIYDEQIVEPLAITLRDGIVLEAWVVRPVTPEGVQVPVIAQLTPYLGHWQGPEVEIDRMLREGEYVARGYAVVTVAIRGTGHSGGCVEFQGAHERDDYAEVIDAIIAQPWAADAVGAVGLSWVGTVPNAALLSGHPALKTIIPISAISDWHRWPFLNGVPWFYVGATWNLYGSLLLMTDIDVGQGHNGTEGDIAALMTRACDGYGETQYEGLASGATGARSAWWDEREFSRHLPAATHDVGVLAVQGWHDWGVRTDQLTDWLPALVEQGYETRAVLGQWTHVWPDYGNPHTNPPELLRHSSKLPIWNVTMLRWFDHWLKGAETGILDMPPVLTQDESWAWHEEDAFVPSRVQPQRLYLDEGGVLAGSPGDGLAAFIDNGLDPSASLIQGPEAAYYASAPLDRPLRYMGTPEIHLDVTHTAAIGHVGVTLYDISESGWYPIHFGFANYNLRNDPAVVDPVIPGVPFSVTVPVLPYDVVIPAGHRLGIAVGNQIELEPLNMAAAPFLPTPSGGTTFIHHGEGSYIDLQVLDDIERVVFPGEPPRP